VPQGPKHVMLSYSWAHQDIFKRIRDFLESQSIRVWMDLDFMMVSMPLLL
jgi:hypothetical protein